MRLLLTPITITKLVVATILCGMIAIIWIVAVGNGPSVGSVHIESANATSGKAGTVDHPALALGTAVTTATPSTLDLGSGKPVDIGQGESDAGATLAYNTPGS